VTGPGRGDRHHRRLRPRTDDDDGYTLATVVTVAMLVMVLLTAVLVPIVSDSRTTGNVRREVDGRLLAETVLNELYAAVVADPDGIDTVDLAGRIAPGKRVTDAGLVAGWATYDPSTRTYRGCADLREPCFSYALTQEPGTAAHPGKVAVAEVTARVGCSTGPQSCTYVRLQQRWRRREFLDYLVFTERETTAPELYPAAQQSWAAANCDRPPAEPGTAPTPAQRPTGCTDVAYVGHVAATTPPSALWVGEEWINTTGQPWTFATVPLDRPASTTRQRAGTLTGTVAAITRGAVLAATQVEATAAGTHTLAVTTSQPVRVRWRVGSGAWGSATTSGPWTSPAIALAAGDRLTVEVLVLDDDPTRFDTQVSLATPTSPSRPLVDTNLGALGVVPRTLSLAEATDRLDGALHTNDPWYWVCGTPSFSELVETTGSSAFRAASPTCAAAANLVAPSGRAATGPVLPLPTSATPFADVAGPSWTFSGPATVTLAGSNVTIRDGTGTTTTRFTPRGGAIYVNGDLTVDGSADELTVAASGSVTVDGDLTGTDLGIVAGAGIRIAWSASGRTIAAALLALGGTVSVTGWDTEVPPLTGPPVLTFTGAMVARFRPVFATYDQRDGTLLTGMVKDFSYPSRPPNPPWFLGPVRALWDRVELAELPALTDGVALAPDPARTTAVGGCGGPGSGALPYLVDCLGP
jgi:hypothetical protein